MSSPTEFRCDEKLVARLEQANLPLHALRVFYALHFLIDADRFKQVGMMGLPNRRSFEVKARKIVQAAFPPGTNDLRLIQTAGRPLIEADLLQRYDYDSSHNSLTFRYSDYAITDAAPLRNGKFAIIDSLMLARLSSSAQVALYVRTTLHQGAQAPQFYLPLQSKGRQWIAQRRPWLSAAAKLSTMLGLQFLICPEIDRMSERIARVTVKISHSGTTWYPGSLYYRGADKPPIVVAGGEVRTITRDELLRREAWTKVGPVPV